MAASNRFIRSAGAYLRTLALVILVWWLASLWLGKDYLLPGPHKVFAEALKLLLSGKVLSAVRVSAERLLIAYALAACVGLVIGVAMGLSRWAAALFDWLIEMLRPISGIAWIPVLLVVFGVSNALPVSIIFISAVFPFILNTASGVRNVDRRLINAGRALGASRSRLLRTVMLPSAVPDILTGARVAASNSWMALIAAELIGAPNGIGYNIGYAQELGNPRLALAWIVYVGVCGYLLDTSLRALQTKLTPWHSGLKVGNQ